jgi:hypothetical protein
MKIIIHVGLPKTGTKSLQSFFWEFREPIAEAGLYYPVSGCVKPGHAHHNIGWSYSRKPKLKARLDAAVGAEADLIKEIRQVDKDVLISSEGLWALARDEPARLAAFIADAGAGRKVKFVVTWRNAAEYCESLYFQRAKVMQVKSIEKAAPRFFDVPPQFEKVVTFLTKVKGAEVVVVQYGKDMHELFLNMMSTHMSVKIDRDLKAKRVINTSMSVAQRLIAAHLSLSKTRFDPKTYRRILRSLGQGTSKEFKGEDRSIMPKGLQRKLIDLSVESLKRLVKNNPKVTLYPETLPEEIKTRPYLMDETDVFTFPALRDALTELEKSAVG